MGRYENTNKDGHWVLVDHSFICYQCMGFGVLMTDGVTWSTAAVLKWGWLCPSGDILQCLGTFFIVVTWRGSDALGVLADCQGRCWSSSSEQRPETEKCPVQWSAVPRLRTPGPEHVRTFRAARLRLGCLFSLSSAWGEGGHSRCWWVCVRGGAGRTLDGQPRFPAPPTLTKQHLHPQVTSQAWKGQRQLGAWSLHPVN